MMAETTVDPSLLKKDDLIFVKSKTTDEWDTIVYVVTKDGSKLMNGWAQFRATSILRNEVLEDINQGLACNMPKTGCNSDFTFRRYQVWRCCENYTQRIILFSF